MKTTLFTIVLLAFAGMAWGQEEIVIKKGGNYYLDPSIILTDNLFTKTDKSTLSSNTFKGKNYKLRVKNVVDGKVYFEFWRFSDSIKRKEINGEKEDAIYEVSEEDFKKMVSVYYNRVDWRVGAFNVPFKLRFSDFDFTSNINIGANLGAKIRWYRQQQNGFSLEPVLGIGITGVEVNDSNSKATESSNLIAFSINTGLLVHITQNINVGILYGFDNLTSKDQKRYDWKHNGNGWLGVGINVTFSSGNSNTGAGGNNN